MSIYCNGHSIAFQLGYSSLRDKELRDQKSIDLEQYSKSTTFLTKSQAQPADPALVAYHVGQADCDLEKIRRLGEWIVGNLGTCDFLRNNCHHFVFCLLARILCRGRNYTVFMGSMLQITMMATKARSGDLQFCNGFHIGSRLAGPDEGPAPRAFGAKNGCRLHFLRSWWKRFRVNQKSIREHINCIIYELKELPDNILEYSAWRWWLLYSLVKDHFPKVRGLLLKRKSPYK